MCRGWKRGRGGNVMVLLWGAVHDWRCTTGPSGGVKSEKGECVVKGQRMHEGQPGQV